MTVSCESRLCFIIAMPTKYLQYKECIHSAVVLSACSYRRNRTRTNKESEKVYVESGSGGVAMVNMTENPSYMTTKEVKMSCLSGGVAMVNMTENPSYMTAKEVKMSCGSGGVAMVNMTENLSYMTAKEVLTSFTYNTEEDKADKNIYGDTLLRLMRDILISAKCKLSLVCILSFIISYELEY